MPRTILDVTRLLTRAGHPIATGVDRVELAYARRILAAPPRSTGFAAVVRDRAAPLPRDEVAAFVAALDDKWRAGRGDATAFGRLAVWLGAPLSAGGGATSSAPGGGDVFRRALKLRASAALAMRRPAAASGDVYVHVSHIRLDRPAVFGRIRDAGAKLAVMVHDLIPIRYPEYGREGEAARHARRMETVLGHATTAIANSAETARDLSAYAAERNIAPPPVLAAPLGIETGFSDETQALAAATPYFVALGTIEPRKNHLLLLHVWRDLVDRLGDAAPALVLVGRRGWENEMVVDLLERSPAIRRRVIEVNDLPDEGLAALMKGARALLFPSFAEGYGLPLAEALALGAPAIAADLPAFREIAGDRPTYLDPLDGPAWREAALAFAADGSVVREQALARIEGFAAPTWDEHFRLVDGVIGLA